MWEEGLVAEGLDGADCRACWTKVVRKQQIGPSLMYSPEKLKRNVRKRLKLWQKLKGRRERGGETPPDDGGEDVEDESFERKTQWEKEKCTIYELLSTSN